jgi:hypothetical protein
MTGNAFARTGPAAVQAGTPVPAAAGKHHFTGIDSAHSNLAKSTLAATAGNVALGDCQGNESNPPLCYTPPDPDIAAGPSELIETVNCTVAAYSKAGTQLGISDVRGLFGRDGTEGCTDPRIIYIPWIGRFAISYWENGGDGGSPIRFAISKTSNPSMSESSWFEFATPAGADQPKIEATSDTFEVVGDTDTGATFYVYELSQIESGAANPVVATLTTTDPVPQPTVNYSEPSVGYFASVVGTSGFQLLKISGRPTLGNVTLSVLYNSGQVIVQPIDPAVPGGAIGGGVLSNAALGAAYEVEASDNHPVADFSGTTECSGRACLFDIKLDLSQSTPYITKDLTIGQPGSADYTFGSVSLDAFGNAYLAYSKSDANDTPDADVVADNDKGQILFNSQIQAHTAGTTACGDSNCDERWGDYMGSAQDPANPNDMWDVSQYQAESGPFGWGTAFAESNSSGIIG